MLVTWDAPADEFVQTGGSIWIQYKRTDQANWISWVPVPGNQTFDYIMPVITDATYVVRMWSVNRLGVKSVVVYSDPTTASADTTPPAAPTGFTASDGVLGVYLNWTNGGDSDRDRTEIYESTASSSAPVATSIPVDSVAGTENSYFRTGLPVGDTRFYWVRAVDTSGNKSAWVGPHGATARAELSVSAAPASQSQYGVIPSGLHLTLSGSVTATATGGVAPYSYDWRGGGPFDTTLSTFTESYDFYTPQQRTSRLTCVITDARGAQRTTNECIIQYTAAPR